MILANSKFATIPSHFDLFKIIFFENDVSSSYCATYAYNVNPLSANPQKWSNTLKKLFECVDQFWGLALKGLSIWHLRIRY